MSHRFLGLLLLAPAGCHGEESSKNIEIPGSLRAHYEMNATAALDAAAPETITISAYFQSGADNVIFDQGETLFVNDVTMARDGKDFSATIPFEDEPADWVFRLDAPGKGAFSTTAAFAVPADLTEPSDGATIAAGADLTVTWSNTDPLYFDHLEIVFQLNAGVGTDPRIAVDANGATSVTIPGSSMLEAYEAAALDPGAPVTARLDVWRSGSPDPADPAPYEDVSIRAYRTLGAATLTVMP
jgi:hypothetical protein